MGKTHRKNKNFTEVTWEDMDEYVSDAFHSRKEAKRKGVKERYDPEEENDESYGSFQKIGKRRCPKTTY